METALLIYVVCGVIAYIFEAEVIQSDFNIIYTGTKLHIANTLAAVIVIILWPYILYRRYK